MQIIPLNPVPSQAVTVLLAGQVCQINVYQKLYGLFVDLYVNGVRLIGGAMALDRNRLVRSTYLGFIGDLIFFDTQAADDPSFDGLGTRYRLGYLSPDEVIEA